MDAVTRSYDSTLVCGECGANDVRVIDSRKHSDSVLRRRRLCCACNYRWTTYEIPAHLFEKITEVQKLADAFLEFRADILSPKRRKRSTFSRSPKQSTTSPSRLDDSA